jgi:ribosomal protein L11 methyltransferase
VRGRSGRAPSVLFRIAAPPGEMERLVAELASLGTSGLEERDDALLAYFPAEGAPLAELHALADPARGVAVHGPEPVPERDWEELWRAGLAPRRIGALWVRPSFAESPGKPELVIDPQQAFGSGEHATTRLALGLVLDELRAGDRVLDVGTGSGILALGALRMGAGAALGFDSDPVAIANAAENRARNALPLGLFAGTLEALAPAARFDLVVANLLLHELLPIVDALAGRARRGLVVSGYLAGERAKLEAATAGGAWHCVRESSEIQSGDRWCARLLHHAAAR